MEHVDSVVVGAGQAGLAMSWHLSDHGIPHMVIERGRIGERWRSERWRSLHFQFPNRWIGLPGYTYCGPEPDGFSHYSAIAELIEQYAISIEAPLRTGVSVESVSQEPNGGFRIETSEGPIHANRVVLATGPFQRSFIPPIAEQFPGWMMQLHAKDYVEPKQLPPGAVLVVGSSASGAQIAEELIRAGRGVYLCVSRHKRLPRRHLGRDVTWWALELGLLDRTVDDWPDGRMPSPLLVTGVDGGHDLDLPVLEELGVVLLGRLESIRGNRIGTADNVAEVIREADEGLAQFLAAADVLARRYGLKGNEQPPQLRRASAATGAPAVDLKAAGISSVIWCTGYQYDLQWVHAPVFDGRGKPMQRRGITGCPGLYFLGLHWMHTFKSGTVLGVGADAQFIVEHMSSI